MFHLADDGYIAICVRLKCFNGSVLRKVLFLKEVRKLGIIFTSDVSLERNYQLNNVLFKKLRYFLITSNRYHAVISLMPIMGLPKRNENSGISRYCGALIWPRYGLCEIARLYCLYN